MTFERKPNQLKSWPGGGVRVKVDNRDLDIAVRVYKPDLLHIISRESWGVINQALWKTLMTGFTSLEDYKKATDAIALEEYGVGVFSQRTGVEETFETAIPSTQEKLYEGFKSGTHPRTLIRHLGRIAGLTQRNPANAKRLELCKFAHNDNEWQISESGFIFKTNNESSFSIQCKDAAFSEKPVFHAYRGRADLPDAESLVESEALEEAVEAIEADIRQMRP